MAGTPQFLADLIGASDDDRRARLERVHPEFKSHQTAWQVLLDAFEGEGGFLDGSYLWPYPSENDTDFSKRCAMARYHNYLETLVDLYVRFIFTQGVKRDSKNKDYNDWLANVDGAGTAINDFLKSASSVGLVTGHAGILVDKTKDKPLGPSKAEEVARPMASVFTSLSVRDWRFSDNLLDAVKLQEAAPQPGILAKEDGPSCQYLIWAVDGWARFAENGQLLEVDDPGLGLVPLIILRPKESQNSQMLGRALISNANVVRALFNRTSEEDNVLRDQAFSVLTVEVPPEGDVAQVKAGLGSSVGSAKALVVKGAIKYETPDMNVPSAIRDNISFLIQELYRAAHVRFKKEGLAAESADSIRLQYTELNEMLQGFAKSLMECELAMARCWFAWQYPSPQAAQEAYDAAEITAQYPDEFFLDALIIDLQAWAEALSLNLGPTMAKRIKKKAVRRVDQDIPPDQLEKIDGEIDAMKDADLNPSFMGDQLTQSQVDMNNNPPPGANA